MSLSMRWVLERQTRDQKWEAVLSSASLDRHDSYMEKSVALKIGAWSRSSLFAVISGLPSSGRGQTNPDLEPFADPGLPLDASPYAHQFLIDPVRMNHNHSVMQPGGCRPGHIPIEKLTQILGEGPHPGKHHGILSGNAPAEDYLMQILSAIEAISWGADYNMTDFEILVGDVTTSPGGRDYFHPTLDRLSHHARVDLRARKQRLLPCRAQTIRMLLSYTM